MSDEPAGGEPPDIPPARVRGQAAGCGGTGALASRAAKTQRLQHRSWHDGRDVASAVAATVSSSLPVFLTGALAVQIRANLHFGTTAYGVAIALYYLAAGTCSIPLGRLSERLGGLRTMQGAVVGSSLVLALLAVASRSWALLVVLLVAAGVASAAMQPAANVFLVGRVTLKHQGISFGVKQAAVPLATSLAGLAVPALALTIGWRWAFATAAAWAIATALLLGRSVATSRPPQPDAPRPTTSTLPRRALVVLAVGFGMGIGTASALTAFLVTSAVSSGVSHANAGLLVAFGSLAAVCARVVVGYRADHRADNGGRSHLAVVSAMLLVGACGYGTLAIAADDHSLAVYALGTAVAFAVGWGWNGLFNFAVVRMSPSRAGRATGITQTGGRLGGMAGPFLFGLLASHTSYSTAWALSGGLMVVAAGTMLVARQMLIGEAPAVEPAMTVLPDAGTGA